MAKQYPFEIQVVNRAFGSAERIPETMWRTVGRASHPLTALRRAEKERRSVTPLPGSWTGHVRILCGGTQVTIEDHGNIVRSADTFSHVDWKAFA